jgi:hypothetical protein
LEATRADNFTDVEELAEKGLKIAFASFQFSGLEV